jgi:hypothetical protein
MYLYDDPYNTDENKDELLAALARGQQSLEQQPSNVDLDLSQDPQAIYGYSQAPTMDLSQRPYVENSDGSVSTVRSMGVNLDGKEYLIPTVSNAGWVLSPDDAVDEFRRTGQHMGVYPSAAASDLAGELMHQDQERNPPKNTLTERHVQLDPLTVTGHMAAPDMSADEFPTDGWPSTPDASPLERALMPDQKPNGQPAQRTPAPSPALAAASTPATSADSGSDSGNPLGALSGWALVADLLVNRGRGVPSIIATAAAQTAAGKKKDTDATSQALRQRQLDLEERRLNQQDALFKQRVDTSTQKSDQSNANRDGMLAELDSLGYEVPDSLRKADATTIAKVLVDARQQWQREHPDEASKADYSKRYVTTEAALDAKHDAAPVQAQDAADQAALVASEKLPVQRQLPAKPMTPQQQIATDKETALHSDMPGTIPVDEEAWKAATASPANRAGISKYVSGVGGAVTALDDMIKIREQFGSELYGPEKAAYAAAQKRVIAAYSQIGNSGVLNGREYERYAEIIPSITPGITDAMDSVADVWAKLNGEPTSHDTNLSKLKSVRDETIKLADAGLVTAGRRLDPNAFRGGVTPQAKTQSDPLNDLASKFGFQVAQ